MAFILLNGIELAAAQDQATRDDVEIGEGLARAYDGSSLRTNRGFKRVWAGTTIPLEPLYSAALRKLLQQRFQHWSFGTSTLDSDLGRMPVTSSGCTRSAGAGPFGGDAMSMGASTAVISWPKLGGVPGRDGFTLLVLRKNGAAWDDWALSWNASGALSAVYLNGVAQALTLPSWISSYAHATGTLTLNNTSGSTQVVAEIAALAFEAPLAAWATALHAYRASAAWPTGPGIAMTGDVVSGSLVVQGKPAQTKLIYVRIDDTDYQAGEVWQFEIWEA